MVYVLQLGSFNFLICNKEDIKRSPFSNINYSFFFFFLIKKKWNKIELKKKKNGKMNFVYKTIYIHYHKLREINIKWSDCNTNRTMQTNDFMSCTMYISHLLFIFVAFVVVSFFFLMVNFARFAFVPLHSAHSIRFYLILFK